MAVTTWLLLSLLTVQTVTGQGLRHRDFKDAGNMLQAELENLVRKQLSGGKHGVEHFDSFSRHLPAFSKT